MKTHDSSSPRLWNRECAAAFLILIAFSAISFWYVFSQHAGDLDGDGWSHVKRARMLTDSLVPGYPQIGAIWLPLLHVLAAPLAMNNTLWKTGAACSLISMASFVVAGIGLFLLLRLMFERRSVVWPAFSIFVLNPSVLYYQCTPMQELLSMALLVLNVLFLARWQSAAAESRKYLWLAGFMNALAALNRYDGWFFIPFGTAWALIATVEGRERSWKARLGDAFIYGFVASLAPVYWLAHNWFMYGDALEWIRGRYSARALYLRQIAEYHFRYPTDGHPWLAMLYYTKSVRYCAGELAFWLATGGLMIVLIRAVRRFFSRSEIRESARWTFRSAHLLFLAPFGFYVYCLATGRVPTYVADYWPYTNFGIRYGHTPIPAIIALIGILFAFLDQRIRTRWLRWSVVATLFVVLFFPMRLAVRTHLLSIPAEAEPYLNNQDDRRLLSHLARYVKSNWHGEMMLMDTGYLGRIAQLDEIPYRKIYSEENFSLWEFVRRYPFPEVQWVFAQEGDDVWKSIQTVPAFHQYYREVLVLRGQRAHVIHVYRHFAPGD